MHYPNNHERTQIMRRDARLRIWASIIVVAIFATILHSCPAKAGPDGDMLKRDVDTFCRYPLQSVQFQLCVQQQTDWHLRRIDRTYDMRRDLQAQSDRANSQLQLELMRQRMQQLENELRLAPHWK